MHDGRIVGRIYRKNRTARETCRWLSSRTIVPNGHTDNIHLTWQAEIAVAGTNATPELGITIFQYTQPSIQAGYPQEAIVSQPRSIFVIDDDPGMLRSLERLLKVHGFDVRAFENAEAFLDN